MPLPTSLQIASVDSTSPGTRTLVGWMPGWASKWRGAPRGGGGGRRGPRCAAEAAPVTPGGGAAPPRGGVGARPPPPPRLVGEAVQPRRRRVAAALGAVALNHRRDERHDERRLVGLYVRHRVGGDSHPLLEDADVAADDEAELAQLLRPPPEGARRF